MMTAHAGAAIFMAERQDNGAPDERLKGVGRGRHRRGEETVACDQDHRRRHHRPWPRAGVRAALPQLGVLEGGQAAPGFPGSDLAWAPDHSSLFALTTLWESTGACLAWQTQQLLPVPLSHPDVVGLGQPGTADILEVEPGLASAHATSSSGQVAATPALTRRTAARERRSTRSCAA